MSGVNKSKEINEKYKVFLKKSSTVMWIVSRIYSLVSSIKGKNNTLVIDFLEVVL